MVSPSAVDGGATIEERDGGIIGPAPDAGSVARDAGASAFDAGADRMRDGGRSRDGGGTFFDGGSATGAPTFPCFSNASGAPCTPFIDMAPADRYWGVFQGGLYPSGSNEVPADHLTRGLARANAVVPRATSGAPDPSGKYVMLTVGFSNQTRELCGASRGLAEICNPWTVFGMMHADELAGRTDPHLALFNGAQGGVVLDRWETPGSTEYDEIAMGLTRSGLSEAQVQVVAVQVTFQHQVSDLSLQDTMALCAVDSRADACRLLQGYGRTIRALRVRYPNLQQVFFNSRTYGGWQLPSLWDGHGNPEPFGYESGFAMKWAIEAQIGQESGGAADPVAGDLSYGPGPGAWVAWSAYNWANGATAPARSDGITWPRASFDPADGIHETPHSGTLPCERDARGAYVCGEAVAARPIYAFFATSRLTRCWYASTSSACE